MDLLCEISYPVRPAVNFRVPKMLLGFLAVRLASAFVVQTAFVPDEYWQSLEVAHNLVYGYGYLTWEWKKGIRSYIYPLMFGALYKCCQLLALDNYFILVTSPRLLQASLSAVGDYCTAMFMNQNFGKESAKWTAFCLLTSWFWFYSGSRTLTNTAEAGLTGIALYFYPWDSQEEKSPIKYFSLVCFACLIRPTAAVVWLPLCIYHIWRARKQFYRCVLHYCFVSVLTLTISVLVDYMCYEKWTLVMWNFLEFNVMSGLGSFYGVHPWHWYFTQGLPVVLGPHLVIFALAVLQMRGNQKVLLCVILWTLAVYSFLPHKEFRFILPILPFMCALCGSYLQRLTTGADKDHPKEFLGLLKITMALSLLVNIGMAVYFALFHQRGTLDVMEYLSEESQDTKNTSLLFLMPCHSTPFYSHLHANVPARFLTCEPNFDREENYVDEADVFYRHPSNWLEENYSDALLLPTHVVMFDVLKKNDVHYVAEDGKMVHRDS